MAMEQIKPYKKPEQLQSYWVEVPGSSSVSGSALPPPTASQPVVARRTKRKKNVGENLLSKLSVPNMMMLGRQASVSTTTSTTTTTTEPSSSTSPFKEDGSNDATSTSPSSSSSFTRATATANGLRSSCPPPTRRQNHHQNRNSSCIDVQTIDCHQELTGSRLGTPTNLNRLKTSSFNASNNANWVQNKIQAVRKSRLFSLLKSSGSKEKPSKWTKSDDFQAEFFDSTHHELTASLIARRSPNDLCVGSRLGQQMELQATSSRASTDSRTSGQATAATAATCPIQNVNKQANGNDDLPSSSPSLPQHQSSSLKWLQLPSSTTTTTTTSSNDHPHHHHSGQQQSSWTPIGAHLHHPVPRTTTTAASSSKRPRPRSACLDNTYLLRIRNGNFLEFSLDSKEEKCSIVSSTNQLTTTASKQISTPHPSPSSTTATPPTSTSVSNKSSTVAAAATGQASPLSSSISLSSGEAARGSSPPPPEMMASTVVTPTTKHHSSLNKQDSFSVDSINVYWPPKKVTEVSILNDRETASDVIERFLSSHVTLNNQGGGSCSQFLYALRLICRSSTEHQDCLWLHPNKNMNEFLEQNQARLESGWKFELRIRYIPANLDHLYQQDYLSFLFLYEQVLEDYLRLELTKKMVDVNFDLIVEISCLELRRKRPELSVQDLDKKSVCESIEGDLLSYFPFGNVNVDSTLKKKLRKYIRDQYKSTSLVAKSDVTKRFLVEVVHLVNFRTEKFQCSLGESSWSVSVLVLIGADGIDYVSGNNTQPVNVTKSYDQVEEVSINSHATLNRTHGNPTDSPANVTVNKKVLVNVKIKGEDDLLIFSCPTFAQAQSIADLIDGYHRLRTNSSRSIWKDCQGKGTGSRSIQSESRVQPLESNSVSVSIVPRKAQFELLGTWEKSKNEADIENDLKRLESSSGLSNQNPQRKPAEEEDEEGEEDYSNPMECCYTEIVREHLFIDEVIGNGQFGDVHKGYYYPPSSSGSFQKANRDSTMAENKIPVAIKISRLKSYGSDGGGGGGGSGLGTCSDDHKLLCEAERMNTLAHPNIIKLIGVCSTSPVYVVMELAQHGELRNFLQAHAATLEFHRLIEYSHQIASALAFLESKQYVHRDIAARNVLVFSFDTVKLADFGLSRNIEDESYYVASNSKLPIKWMAPESIKYRRFTSSSDVWMFAVCMWEIFMLGQKPFQGVRNGEVIDLLEKGERLAKPNRCPQSLYDMMLKCWRYEPDRRPSFLAIRRSIHNVYQNELGLVGALASVTLDECGSSSMAASLPSSSSSSSSNTSSLLSERGTNHHHRHSSQSSTNSLSSRHHKQHQRGNSQSNNNNKEPFLVAIAQNSPSSTTAASANSVDGSKIKKILDEQRRQMEEDNKWLASKEKCSSFGAISNSNAQQHRYGSSSRLTDNSTPTSNYEDARDGDDDDGEGEDDHLGHPRGNKSLNASNENNNNESQYNSLDPSNGNSFNSLHESSTSSSSSSSTCGLSKTLKKFFKYNHLNDDQVRARMMNKLNYSSAKVNRDKDYVYWNTINVVTAVRLLLKGIQDFNTSAYIDLVKDVGLELRNLLASVDMMLAVLPPNDHSNIAIAQKKLSSDMNELVESMKKTVTFSETPMEGAYKQNMLESAYVLVIDCKNLMDTLDEIRISLKLEQLSLEKEKEKRLSRKGKLSAEDDDDERIYANDNVYEAMHLKPPT